MSTNKQPLPGEEENEESLQLEMVEDGEEASTPRLQPLAPTTTVEEDKITTSQRTTSLMWESVQASIAVSITLATIYCAVFQINSETIVNAFFFIVATYFTRTNHTRVGGLGQRIDGVYRGR